MSALNLIRIPTDTNELARLAAERGWGWIRDRGRDAAFDEGRALHHLLTECFGPGVLATFRLLVAPRRTRGNLYAYSRLDADTLRGLISAHGLPEHLGVLDARRLSTKPMPKTWRVGQRLGFDLRLRPVRRLNADLTTPSGSIPRGTEVDSFLLEALRRHPTTKNGMASSERTRQTVYLEWLADRFGVAATLDWSTSSLVRFRRVRVARGDQGPEGPDATIHGTLVIRDTPAFVALLERGLGRHRAYGYGMLLLHPPRRPPAEKRLC